MLRRREVLYAVWLRIERGDLQIDTKDAKYIIFDIGMDEGYNRVISFTLARDNRGYLISCLAEASKFDEYVSQFEQAANSFRFE